MNASTTTPPVSVLALVSFESFSDNDEEATVQELTYFLDGSSVIHSSYDGTVTYFKLFKAQASTAVEAWALIETQAMAWRDRTVAREFPSHEVTLYEDTVVRVGEEEAIIRTPAEAWEAWEKLLLHTPALAEALEEAVWYLGLIKAVRTAQAAVLQSRATNKSPPEKYFREWAVDEGGAIWHGSKPTWQPLPEEKEL